MNPAPLTQFLSNNQKEIIAGVFAIIVAIIGGVFLLLSIAMTKETPAPVVKNYNYGPTYTTINVAASPIPQVAHKHKEHRRHKLTRKPHLKPVAKPLLQPSCPCADSAKMGV